MKNNSYKSPSEINKFVYCNYAWYYEKTLGQKYINEVRKEKLEELGISDSAYSNFSKGRKFHNNYRKKEIFITVLKLIILIIIAICILYFSSYLPSFDRIIL